MDKTLHTSPKPDDTPPASCCGSACGSVSITPAPAPPMPAPAPTPTQAGLHRYRIANMDCSSEESEIRRALEPIAGVKQLRFDLGQRTVSLAAEPADLTAAIAAIERIGYKPQPLTEPTADAAGGREQGVDHDHAHVESGLPRLIGALAFAIAAEAVAFFAPETALLKGVQILLAVLAIYLAGFGTYQKGLLALKAGRLNINALMTVAVTGAFVIGQWPEAAMVMALYAVAELIEAKAVDRARNAIKSLLDLAPQDAEVQQADGQWQRMPTAAVAVGAIVRLRPGERVPLDGMVTAGASAIDQAPVTGESVPVDKGVGDEVFAGTINQNAALEFRVTALATDSTLARIIHAVEEAQATRAPTQRFVDRFAAIYTPGVFVLALGVALLMPWLMGWTWMEAVYKALVLLVIACPCALGLATPISIIAGVGKAAQSGILIRNGEALQQAAKLDTIVLDKTGTITRGKPTLNAIHVADGHDADHLLQLTASL